MLNIKYMKTRSDMNSYMKDVPNVYTLNPGQTSGQNIHAELTCIASQMTLKMIKFSIYIFMLTLSVRDWSQSFKMWIKAFIYVMFIIS